jgi:DNA replication protein DnaC
MRHDLASAAVVVMLRGLKMFGMAQAVGELIEQGAPAFDAAVPILSQLLKAEMAEREVRSISYQIKAARFPAYKDLAGFDFAASEVNEALIRQLHRGDFMDGADNVVLIGGPGTGKSHMATALGEAAQGSACEARGMAAEGARRSSITARRSGSSPPSIWSMLLSKRRQ